jgi:hypothetical protein
VGDYFGIAVFLRSGMRCSFRLVYGGVVRDAEGWMGIEDAPARSLEF